MWQHGNIDQIKQHSQKTSIALNTFIKMYATAHACMTLYNYLDVFQMSLKLWHTLSTKNLPGILLVEKLLCFSESHASVTKPTCDL